MTINVYADFDEYGLNHLAQHLYTLQDFDALYKIVTDADWHELRSIQDPSRIVLAGEVKLAISAASLGGGKYVPRLIALRFLEECLGPGNLNSSTGIKLVAELGKAPVIDNLIPLGNLDVALEAIGHFLSVGEIDRARRYFKGVHQQLFRDPDPIYCSDRQLVHLIKLQNEFIARGDHAIKNYDIERLITFGGRQTRRYLCNAWEQLYRGDISGINQTVRLTLEIIDNDATQYDAIQIILLVNELLVILQQNEKARDLLTLAWQKANGLTGQGRGGAFRDISFAYAVMGDFVSALHAVNEIPRDSIYDFVRAECLEQISLVEVKAGFKASAASTLLLAAQFRQSSNDIGPVSAGLLYALLNLGHSDLAASGLSTISEDFDRNWNTISSAFVEEVLSSYMTPEPVTWFQIVEQKNRQLSSRSIVRDAQNISNLKMRSEIIQEAWPAVLRQQSVNQIVDTDQNILLELIDISREDISNMIRNVRSKIGDCRLEFATLAKALLCEAMLKLAKDDHELSQWVIEMLTQTSPKIELLDSLTLFCPAIEKLGLISATLDEWRSAYKVSLGKVAGKELLRLVKQHLLEDVDFKIEIQSTLVDDQLTDSEYSQVIRSYLEYANIELREHNFPPLFLLPDRSLRATNNFSVDRFETFNQLLLNYGLLAKVI